MLSKEEIMSCIDDYFGDTTRSKRETLEDLDEIQGHIESMTCCLQEEIDRDS